MGPTLKNLPKTSGCVLYPARNSKVPISFGSTSSTSTVRRRTKCARTWSISTIISAIRRDRSYPSIRAIVRPEHDLLPPMNLPEAIPSEPLAVNLGMGLATAQVEEVTVEVMVDRRSKLDSPEAVGILDLVAGIIVVEEAEGPSYPTKVGLLLAMMTLILQPTSTSSKKKIKIFPQNISFALLFPRTALFLVVTFIQHLSHSFHCPNKPALNKQQAAELYCCRLCLQLIHSIFFSLSSGGPRHMSHYRDLDAPKEDDY